jgi:hypothetical protein
MTPVLTTPLDRRCQSSRPDRERHHPDLASAVSNAARLLCDQMSHDMELRPPLSATAVGQSGQRRRLAQDGSSGVRAVAAAASAPRRRRAAPRGSERRVDVGVALGQEDAECPLCARRPRDARWNKRD